MKKPTRVERKMRRRRFFFKSFIFIFILSGLAIFALNSGYFNIETIEVFGNNKLDKETIILGSSIRKGENIFKIRLKEGEKNLKNLPYIKDLKIKRKYPKSITIEVLERKEVAEIQWLSSWIIIDEEGFILDILTNEKANLTHIKGLNLDNSKPGEKIIDDLENNFYFFLYSGNSIGLISKIDQIDMEDYGEINFLLKNGIYVAFGGIYNVEYKWNALNEVLKDINQKGLSCKMILMNKGDNPVIVLNEE